MSAEKRMHSDSLTERWQIIAGERTRFALYLDRQEISTPLQSTVGGIPASWVRTSHKNEVVELEFFIPAQTAPGIYPLSLTLTSVNLRSKRTTIPVTLEIHPAAVTPFRLPELQWSPKGFALTALLGVGLWLGLSFWWGAQETGTSNPIERASLAVEGVIVPPLAQMPVMIGADWQAGLATPTIAPTPTLRPSPTPLPPMPTPQPPPAPARATELLEHGADGTYTYERMFQEVGAQFGVDWRLLASIAQRESGLRTDAVGGSGEQGMMQIMPQTWNEFAPLVGESDPFNAYSSTRVAAYYLVYLRDYLYSQGYTESYWLLVAYNWGPNNLRRHLADGGDWGSIPSMRQNYAYTIMDRINATTDSLWTDDIKQEVPY